MFELKSQTLTQIMKKKKYLLKFRTTKTNPKTSAAHQQLMPITLWSFHPVQMWIFGKLIIA